MAHDENYDTPDLSEIASLRFLVKGNGDVKDGLVYKVARLEETQTRQALQWDRIQSMFQKIVAGLVIAGVTALVSLLVNLTKH